MTPFAGKCKADGSWLWWLLDYCAFTDDPNVSVRFWRSVLGGDR